MSLAALAADPEEALELMKEYGPCTTLTLGNSAIKRRTVDRNVMNYVNYRRNRAKRNGVIIYSDLLLGLYKTLQKAYIFVSSTTKVLNKTSEEFLK